MCLIVKHVHATSNVVALFVLQRHGAAVRRHTIRLGPVCRGDALQSTVLRAVFGRVARGGVPLRPSVAVRVPAHCVGPPPVSVQSDRFGCARAPCVSALGKRDGQVILLLCRTSLLRCCDSPGGGEAC